MRFVWKGNTDTKMYHFDFATVAPFVIGMSPVSVKKFILLNAFGALVWAAAVASGGLNLSQKVNNLNPLTAKQVSKPK